MHFVARFVASGQQVKQRPVALQATCTAQLLSGTAIHQAQPVCLKWLFFGAMLMDLHKVMMHAFALLKLSADMS